MCDTHTAVAVNVYGQYKEQTNDRRTTVIASTASPYKFADSVLKAVSDRDSGTEFGNVKLLSDITGAEVPEPIQALERAEVRFFRDTLYISRKKGVYARFRGTNNDTCESS